MGILRALAACALAVSLLGSASGEVADGLTSEELYKLRIRFLEEVLRKRAEKMDLLKKDMMKLEEKLAVAEGLIEKQRKELARRLAQIEQMHGIIQDTGRLAVARPAGSREGPAPMSKEKLERARAQKTEMARRPDSRAAAERVASGADDVGTLTKVIGEHDRAITSALENERDARREKAEMEKQVEAFDRWIKETARKKRDLEMKLAHSNWMVERLRGGGPIAGIVYGGEGPPDPKAPADGGPPVPLTGLVAEVLAVDNKVKLLMLSVGEDDGAKRGHIFTVRRDGVEVARARVERTFRDMCAARMIPEAGTDQVREGDHAVYFGRK